MKWFLMLFVFGLIGCATVVNSIPGGESNISGQIEQIDPEQVKLNNAFLKNIAGNWTNHSATTMGRIVYTITDDGHFFVTNSQGSDGSFTLQTNYSFYGALEAQKGIFISNDNDPNNPIQYKGVRLYNGQLAIEGKSYTNPKNANSSSGYTLYHRK